ncbi:MAG: glycoside hydrolase family 3 N-terminal domain-containing protein [Balneolaceae bacterium]|nr:glycoside hydrolase family 3 N-terminal domain-containing protein [Balneolaceae bacterium]
MNAPDTGSARISSLVLPVLVALLVLLPGSDKPLEGTASALFGERDQTIAARDALPSDTDIDSLLQQMSLEEKIGQLFFISAEGEFHNASDPAYQRLLSGIRDYHVGGLIFFSGNVYGQAMLTNRLQQASDIPLWITQDMEYGAAMRVRDATRIVPAMGIAATGNPGYAYAAGRITASEARALGVHQVFAPVLDVNNNPDNPVINVRSFSGDPQTVARFGNRFIEGVQSQGLVATAKHFPGHGDTDTDSHISLPVIPYDYSRLDTLELVPFRSAIQNGVGSVMSAHIAFPELGKPELPATMDPHVLNRILVDSLGFGGLVVTDGLEMSGISSNYSPGEAVIRSLQAGADVMLLSPDMITAVNEVRRAVERGDLSEARIERSVRKLLELKRSQGLFENATVDLDALNDRIDTIENRVTAEEISRRSITVVRNEGGILPIRAAEYPEVLVLSVADDESGNTGSYLGSRFRDYHPNVTFRVFDRRSGEEEKREILREAREADLVVVGSFIYVRSGQPVQLTDEQLSFVRKVTSSKPSVLIALGNPYVVHDLPESEVQVMAWSASSDQIDAVVPALFGGSAVDGRLPIRIPDMYEMGHGLTLPRTTLRHGRPESVGLSSDSLRRVENLMREAVFDSTFPGGTVTVVKDGVIAYQEGFGYHTYEKTRRTESGDVFDLASLTKMVATTAAVMKLTDEDELSLSDRVGDYIEEFSQGPKRAITVRNLLLHNSGLPPFRVYVDSLQSRGAILEAIRNEPLTYEPGTQYVYSDLGFILLAEIVEQVSGLPLDRYVRSELFYPMGLRDTHFNPSAIGNWFTRRIPPTEIDTVFRNKTIHAEVHDERAWFLEGVAGHAGLFSSGSDLAAFAQMLLDGGTWAGKRYFQTSTVRMFTSDQSPHNTRGLGFDRKSEGFSTAGSLTSPSTFGHLGFTGTSMWIDPERELAVIILTNRTWPHRSYGENISRVRAAVADAVVSSIIDP